MMAQLVAESKMAFRADFGYAEDNNRDGWPDQWRRRTDRDHPRFVKMGIVSRSEISSEDLLQIRRGLTQWSLAWEQGKLPGDTIPESIPRSIDAFLETNVANTCFEISMNGGAAQIESATFPIDSRNAYRFQMQTMAEIIDPFIAETSIIWLDNHGTELARQTLSPIAKSVAWHLVQIPEITGIPSGTSSAKIRLSVQPTGSQSIESIVRFDRIRVDRIPRIELDFAPESRIVKVDEPFEVVCRLNDVAPATSQVRLAARDHNGEEVWQETKALDTSVADANDTVRALWKISIPKAGFYTLSAKVIDVEKSQSQKQTTFVVMPREKSSKQSVNRRIGWSFPELGKSFPFGRVPSIVEYAHVGGVKFSVWVTEQPAVDNRSFSWLVETLVSKGVKCVGVVDAPPVEMQAKFPEKNGKSLASLLDFTNVWQPMFDPLWRRTSLYLSQYQIGWERDASLEQHSHWQTNLAELTKQIRAVGAEAQLTLPWNAFSERPEDSVKPGTAPWNRILSYTSPLMTAAEIATFSQLPHVNPKQNWISVDPLPRKQYSLEDRVRDLAQRLVAVHQYQWEMAWVSDPTSPSQGILDRHGGPDELLLPIEQLALALNNSRDFETIQLNENLHGILFSVDEQERMIVIAEKAMETGVYLGSEMSAVDVWGRSLDSKSRSVNGVETEFITLNQWPVILSNVDRMLARWQIDVHIENSTIENRVGLSEPLRIRLLNPEADAISGTIEVVAPHLLQDERSSIGFTAKERSRSTFEVPMRLRYDAIQSVEPLDIVITLDQEPARAFVVQRSVQVGLKDFQIESQARIDERGYAIVDLEMLNQSDQVANFDCTLVLPNRPRQKFQMIRLEDRKSRTIVIPDGADLQGQSLLLRCEEIGSGRVLNHRVDFK